MRGGGLLVFIALAAVAPGAVSGRGGPRRGSPPSATSAHEQQHHTRHPLTIGLILPKTNFGVRGYNKAIAEATLGLTKPRGRKLEFLKSYVFTPTQVTSQMMELTPSPTGKQELLSTSLTVLSN